MQIDNIVGEQTVVGMDSVVNHDINDRYLDFMWLPTEDEQKVSYHVFIEATSNASLSFVVCIVCARELWSSECAFHMKYCAGILLISLKVLLAS